MPPRCLYLPALFLALPLCALAADRSQPAAPIAVDALTTGPTIQPSRGPARLSPLAADLLAAQERFEHERDALYAKLASARQPAQRLELQRQLEQLKFRSELRLIEIQLDHARQRGDADAIAKLETIVEAARHLTSEERQ